MTRSDYIPQNPTAFVVWFSNFILHLRNLSDKYSVCSDKIDALINDHQWVHYWYEVRWDAREQERRLNRFFNAMINGEVGNGWLTVPVRKPGDALVYIPDNVRPGIKDRIREVVDCIKSQENLYTKADGELLGILTPAEAGWQETDYTPTLKFKQLGDYCLEVDFRKFGLDAVKFEYRYREGDWHFGGFLTKSPDMMKIPPRVMGSPEQIEIRAIFWEDNRNFGNWSANYSVVIVP